MPPPDSFAVLFAKSEKAADVAQDSILVKDADVGGNKTDTAGAATAALMRARGSAANAPVLTTGAPVKRAPDVAFELPARLRPRQSPQSPAVKVRVPTVNGTKFISDLSFGM